MERLASTVREHLIYHEEQIRIAAWKYHSSHHHDTIIHELLVDQGRARIDMAVIGTSLHGIELKSDGDTLNRLHQQMHFYNPTFEKLTLIVGYSHLYEAIEIIPAWWGIVVVEKTTSDCITFDQIRKNKKNPELCGRSVLSLLTRQEVGKLLSGIGFRVPKSASLGFLIDAASSNLEVEQIVNHVKAVLVNRNHLDRAFVIQ